MSTHMFRTTEAWPTSSETAPLITNLHNQHLPELIYYSIVMDLEWLLPDAGRNQFNNYFSFSSGNLFSSVKIVR